jgi:hypothetical protein
LTIQRILGSDMPKGLKLIQEEALKNDGLENAVNTIIGEIARK